VLLFGVRIKLHDNASTYNTDTDNVVNANNIRTDNLNHAVTNDDHTIMRCRGRSA
jgi:uncharacterized protein YdeI (YjbR/CyaY-like superfamily)